MLYDTTTYYRIQAYSQNTCLNGAVLVTSSILASSQLSPNHKHRAAVDGSRADSRPFGAFVASVMVWGGSVAFVRFCAVCGPLAAIQSQVGRPPFLADGFCPLRTSNGSRPARTRARLRHRRGRLRTRRGRFVRVLVGGPACRHGGLDWPRSSGGVLGFSFSRPRGGGGSSAIAGSFGGVVGRSARLRALQSAL